MTPRSLALLGWLACQAAALASIPCAHAADLLVSSQTTNNVLRYDGVTGAFSGVFASGGGMDDPLDLVIGPDSNLYVGSGRSNTVLRFDGRTGAFMGTFASGSELDGPEGMGFGPDGNLYVCSSNTNSVVRFNGTTGAFMDVFVPAGSGGLWLPRALAFGPDHDLFVLSYNDARVLRYDGRSGAFLGRFVPQGSGGLFTPIGMAFGPDGDLYVGGGVFGNLGVRRYDRRTGAFLGFHGRMPGGEVPIDVVFGPDGNLYVSAGGTMHGVLRFDGACGPLIDAFVPSMSGGLSNPFGITFMGRPASRPLPHVDLIRIRAKRPAPWSDFPIFADDSIRVFLAGDFPNDCFRLKRIERFDDRMGPAREPPIVRLVVDDGGCLGRPCSAVPVRWEEAVTLPSLPARGYGLVVQLAQVSCTDSILPENLHSTVVPFCVASVGDGQGLRCVMGGWDHGDSAGGCDAFVSPGHPASLTFQISTSDALAGLEGEFGFQESGLRVVGMEPIGPAADMHLNWMSTAVGARFVLFAENGAPIPASLTPVPVLRLTLAQPSPASDSLDPGPGMARREFHLTTRELLGADRNGGAIPYCVGAFPSIDFLPDVATICTRRDCDFNADGRTDVRDLVLMVHCVNGSGPCPPDPASRFDCDANARFDRADVICCAMQILRAPGCPDCPVDTIRVEPGIVVGLGDPHQTPAELKVPIHLGDTWSIGAARLKIRFPADRFNLLGVESMAGLELHEVTSDEVVVGVIGPWAVYDLAPGMPIPGDITLRLALKPGQRVGGEVTVLEGEFSGPDGVMLDVDLGNPRQSLAGPPPIGLSPARPNPFSGETRFTIELAAPAEVEVGIYDVGGRQVASLFRGALPAGSHAMVWNGRSADGGPAREGIYFYRAGAGGQSKAGKLVLLRGR